MRPIDIFLELQRVAECERKHWVTDALNRACMEVEFFCYPPDPSGAVDRIAREVCRQESRREGRLTSSYHSEETCEESTGRLSPQRGGYRDVKTEAIQKLDELDRRLLAKLSRGRLREYAQHHGFGRYLQAMADKCSVCRSELVDQLNLLRDEGWTLRDLSGWCRAHRQPMSKDLLRRHFEHSQA